MKKKPSVLIVGDTPGWAFHDLIRFFRRNFSSRFDIYYDFTIYNPNKENIFTRENSDGQFNRLKGEYKSELIFRQLPFLQGLEYRIRKMLNKLNLIERNEEGKCRRVRNDNSYDVLILLEYYMDLDADFSHVKYRKKIKGIFTDGFPPQGISRELIKKLNKSNATLTEFYEHFLKDADALLLAVPPMLNTYKDLPMPVFVACAIFDDKLFAPRRKIQHGQKLRIGWTGNPDRQFKNYYSTIVPAIEELKKGDLQIEFLSRFSGPLNTLPDFWNKVDIAVNASVADAGPSMFAEASMCGVPSISTYSGMPIHILEDQKNGCFFDGSKEDLINKLKDIYFNRAKLEGWKKSIRDDFLNKINQKKLIEDWEKLFEYIL